MCGLDIYSLYILVYNTGQMILTVGTKVVGANSISVPVFETKIHHTKWSGTEPVPVI
jgi:hypothetical protein